MKITYTDNIAFDDWTMLIFFFFLNVRTLKISYSQRTKEIRSVYHYRILPQVPVNGIMKPLFFQ